MLRNTLLFLGYWISVSCKVLKFCQKLLHELFMMFSFLCCGKRTVICMLHLGINCTWSLCIILYRCSYIWLAKIWLRILHLYLCGTWVYYESTFTFVRTLWLALWSHIKSLKFFVISLFTFGTSVMLAS
jgi:hypothetical protein